MAKKDLKEIELEIDERILEEGRRLGLDVDGIFEKNLEKFLENPNTFLKEDNLSLVEIAYIKTRMYNRLDEKDRDFEGLASIVFDIGILKRASKDFQKEYLEILLGEVDDKLLLIDKINKEHEEYLAFYKEGLPFN